MSCGTDNNDGTITTIYPRDERGPRALCTNKQDGSRGGFSSLPNQPQLLIRYCPYLPLLRYLYGELHNKPHWRKRYELISVLFWHLIIQPRLLPICFQRGSYGEDLQYT
jgi:hypothetical protein